MSLQKLEIKKESLSEVPLYLTPAPLAANAKFSRQISFAGHRQALPIRCSGWLYS